MFHFSFTGIIILYQIALTHQKDKAILIFDRDNYRFYLNERPEGLREKF